MANSIGWVLGHVRKDGTIIIRVRSNCDSENTWQSLYINFEESVTGRGFETATSTKIIKRKEDRTKQSYL